MDIATIAPNDWLDRLIAADTTVTMQRCFLRTTRAPHRHEPRLMENHLLLLLTQGEAKGWLDDEPMDLRAGDALWIPPGVTRIIEWCEQETAVVDYRIHVDVIENGAALRFSDEGVLKHGAWEMQPVLDMLAHAHHSPKRMQDLHVRGLLMSLSCIFLELDDDQQGSSPTLTSAQRLAVETLVIRHIHDGLEPADLAHEAGLTLDYFTRLFRNTYGKPPRTYLKEQRIRIAAHRLLDTDTRINEIAREMGYTDSNLFTRQFRQVMGCSPRQFRKQPAALQQFGAYGRPDSWT